MKKTIIAATLATAFATLAGCVTQGLVNQGAGAQGASSNSSLQNTAGSVYTKIPGLGDPVDLNTGKNYLALPVGKVPPGLKGKWHGTLEWPQKVHWTEPALILISGSTKRKNLSAEDFSLIWQPSGCRSGMVYITTQQDGAVIFEKISGHDTTICGKGFIRVQPLSNGTLRVSDHHFTVKGEEERAGIFTRMP